MKPLRLPALSPRRALALAGACARHDEEPELRDLAQELRGLLDRANRREPPRPSKLPPAPKKARGITWKQLGATVQGPWPTELLRQAVWERSEGRCENPACGRRIRWETFDLDHYTGRGKARPPQSPENTWALCSSRTGAFAGWCHQQKHAAKPSRLHWHRVFLLHMEQHGFGSSETAKGIRDELAAEEQLREAQRHAALAVEQAQDVSERARRAEGAAST